MKLRIDLLRIAGGGFGVALKLFNAIVGSVYTLFDNRSEFIWD